MYVLYTFRSRLAVPIEERKDRYAPFRPLTKPAGRVSADEQGSFRSALQLRPSALGLVGRPQGWYQIHLLWEHQAKYNVFSLAG
jgi:hypothetical protein